VKVKALDGGGTKTPAKGDGKGKVQIRQDEGRPASSLGQMMAARKDRIAATCMTGPLWTGRAHLDVGRAARQNKVRTLLKESGEPMELWPLAACRKKAEDAAGRNGPSTRALMTLGQEGYATQKIWNEKYQDWKMSRRKVTVLGPDVAMSAAMPGHYVV
jgi:hypothetical protein